MKWILLTTSIFSSRLGHATIAVEHLAVRMEVSGKDGRAHMDSFKVVHLGDYKIKKITGMSVVLNWLLKLIANAVAKKSRGKIIDAMENGVATAVSGLLEKYQLPKLGWEWLLIILHAICLHWWINKYYI